MLQDGIKVMRLLLLMHAFIFKKYKKMPSK